MQIIGNIKSLIRYPIKSMGAEALTTIEITEKGLLGDRSYALIEPGTNKIISAKNPKKWKYIMDLRVRYDLKDSKDKNNKLEIIFPNGTKVNSQEDNLSVKLSSYFNHDVELTSTVPSKVIIEEYLTDTDDERDAIVDADIAQGTFFDLGTVHLITSGTIKHLEQLYPEGDFNLKRFRPNIFIELDSDEVGFVENSWIGQRILIGKEVVLEIQQACPRCVMTTLDQNHLLKDPNILKIAKKHNNGHVGVYANVISTGIIHVNDSIKILD